MQSLAYCEANVNQYNENSPVISNNLTKYLINDQMSMRVGDASWNVAVLGGFSLFGTSSRRATAAGNFASRVQTNTLFSF